MEITIAEQQELKKYNRKKLFDLSTKSAGEIPQLDEPSDEQKEGVERRMRAPSQSWQRWFVGLYFTENQKKELGLTDEDIAGKGMR